jgi:16S rRNA (cytosine1402-N4)-methyltransferase
MHVPIMVAEILDALNPMPGDRIFDCTLGYGGHARELLKRILPGGHLVGLDVDPIEQPRTEERLRAQGFGADVLTVRRSNFAGLPRIVAETGPANAILADLGLSSMQIDTPTRGFSVKHPGPLDMRMNPAKGLPAGEVLARMRPAELTEILRANADEPRATLLATQLAGRHFSRTNELAAVVRAALPRLSKEEGEKAVRRVFQALRIAVNDEFGALETLLRHLPDCLAPGGRVAVLTFHSGEDRRVKQAFETGYRDGRYCAVSDGVVRATPEEIRANPRASSAKLRWARTGFE